MEDTTTRSINISVIFSVLLSGTFYTLVGVFGYLTFYQNTPGNILSGYNESLIFDVIKLTYAALIVFSFPVVGFASRDSIEKLFFSSSDESTIRRIIIAACICFVTLTLAILFPSVEIIFAFTGATFGQLVIFIYPTLYYILLVDVNDGVTQSESSMHVNVELAWQSRQFYFTLKKFPAFVILFIGIVFGCLSVSQIIHGFYN